MIKHTHLAGANRVAGPRQQARRSRRMSWPGFALVSVLLFLITACGQTGHDKEVATAGGSATAGASAGTGGKADEFKFAQCMRDNGIKNWPDPQSDDGTGSKSGGPAKVIGPEGVDPKTVQETMQKCKQYLPNGGEPPENDPAQLEQMRKFAQCMRENGLPKYPDPDAGGGNQGLPREIDPNSAEFKTAQEACKKYMVRPSTSGRAG
ncbi:hypothetical protein [Kribbella sp. VKM Ac-2566]|uniref:hypothetical protein n=1 Tax=Kribbella sp. VKM Ac-2566 TaxID=2512218 RepID=UPI001063960C|nr:hypothetical protein [Kribbella sp. VKM Ac-2566]TDW79543.1 hypothetical protein EV647_8360 [Kribbella sp. VKM Ac-2566]